MSKTFRDGQRIQVSPVGISASGLLGVTFVVLKLLGIIDWSWWWVTLPFWGGAVIVLLILAIVIIHTIIKA